MRILPLVAVLAGAAGLAGCTHEEEHVAVASAPPLGPGAIAGTVAADRDGDGVPDGWYDAGGNYHPFRGPPCPPPPPPPPSRRGERG